MFAALLLAGASVPVVVDTPAASARIRYPSEAWDPGIEEIATRVEQLRGLHFEHPVPVDLLGRYREDRETPWRAELRREGDRLVALGLAPSTDAYTTAAALVARGGPGGMYDEVQGRITVYRTKLDAGARVIVAHELTHALDDQHFGFDPWAHDGEAEGIGASRALEAVIEGDARRVEDLYLDSLAPSERATARRQLAAMTSVEDVAAARSAQWSLVEGDVPYTLGKEITGIAARSGASTLARLFTHPPASDSMLLDPLSILRDDEPPAAAAGSADPGSARQALDRVGVYLLLASRIPATDAFAAARTVEGATVSSVASPDSECVSVRFQTPGDEPPALTRALAQWVGVVGPSAQVETGRNTPVVRACTPPVAADPNTYRVSELLLAARTRAVGDTFARTRSTDTSDCVGDAILADAQYASTVGTETAQSGGALPPLGPVLARARAACA